EARPERLPNGRRAVAVVEDQEPRVLAGAGPLGAVRAFLGLPPAIGGTTQSSGMHGRLASLALCVDVGAGAAAQELGEGRCRSTRPARSSAAGKAGRADRPP